MALKRGTIISSLSRNDEIQDRNWVINGAPAEEALAIRHEARGWQTFRASRTDDSWSIFYRTEQEALAALVNELEARDGRRRSA